MKGHVPGPCHYFTHTAVFQYMNLHFIPDQAGKESPTTNEQGFSGRVASNTKTMGCCWCCLKEDLLKDDSIPLKAQVDDVAEIRHRISYIQVHRNHQGHH